jgi:hypothetical protein
MIDYPFPINLRWNHLQWFPLFFNRYQRSEFCLLADMDVQGAALNLFAISMDLLPPATLPLETDICAHYLRITPEEWSDMLARDITPLHGWQKIQCGKEVRLAHPIMLEGLEVAVKAFKLRQRGTTQRRSGEPPDAGRAPR